MPTTQHDAQHLKHVDRAMRRIAQYGESYLAYLAAALDEVQDASKAIHLADSCFKDN
jgi:hypothetical protein